MVTISRKNKVNSCIGFSFIHTSFNFISFLMRIWQIWIQNVTLMQLKVLFLVFGNDKGAMKTEYLSVSYYDQQNLKLTLKKMFQYIN